MKPLPTFGLLAACLSLAASAQGAQLHCVRAWGASAQAATKAMGDHLHGSDLGYKALADCIDLKLFR